MEHSEYTQCTAEGNDEKSCQGLHEEPAEGDDDEDEVDIASLYGEEDYEEWENEEEYDYEEEEVEYLEEELEEEWLGCYLREIHENLQNDNGVDEDEDRDKLESYADLPSSNDAKDTTLEPAASKRPQCKRINATALESPEQLYRDYFVESKPVVIQGGWNDFIQEESFAQNWTLDALAERWGRSRNITVRYHNDNAFQRIHRFLGQGYKYVAPDYVNMTFDAFVQAFTEQEKLILENKDKEEQEESLPEYINLQMLHLFNWQAGGWTNTSHPIYLPPNPLEHLVNLKKLSLWVSGQDKISKLHNDPDDNILVVLSGSKTVYLVEPVKYWKALYVGYFPVLQSRRVAPGQFEFNETDEVFNHFVPIDVLDPDVQRFPAARRLIQENAVVECHLGPGDMLLLPATWWHQVHNHVTDVKKPSENNKDETSSSSSTASSSSPPVNIAVNFWFEANRQILRFRETLLRHVATDWVEQGAACDKYLDMYASFLRLHPEETR